MKKIIHHTKRIAANTIEDIKAQPRRKKERTIMSISAGITGIIALVWIVNGVSNLPDFSKSAASVQLLQEQLINASNQATVAGYDEYGNAVYVENTNQSTETQVEETGPYPQKEVTNLSGETVIVPASDGSVELSDKNKKKEN